MRLLQKGTQVGALSLTHCLTAGCRVPPRSLVCVSGFPRSLPGAEVEVFFTVGRGDRLGPGPVARLCWDPGSARPSILVSSLLSPFPGCQRWTAVGKMSCRLLLPAWDLWTDDPRCQRVPDPVSPGTALRQALPTR